MRSSPFAPATTQPEAEKALSERDEQRIVSLLLQRYIKADEDTVRRALDEAVETFAGARVTAFLPILAERRAAEFLAQSGC
jgi:hypothetical protein